MTCKELITSIVDADDQNGYNMSIDDARKLIAVAYYMGRESATKEVSDRYAAHIAKQHQRADACRYSRMANTVVGPEAFLYNSDYAGDMTSMFGVDPTSLTISDLTGSRKIY